MSPGNSIAHYVYLVDLVSLWCANSAKIRSLISGGGDQHGVSQYYNETPNITMRSVGIRMRSVNIRMRSVILE